MIDFSSVYPEFIAGELTTERERRTNLESRGGAVVTQSGTLSTLLIAAAAFVRGSAAAHLSTYAVTMVVIATFLFLAAGVLGILVSFPYLYKGQPVRTTPPWSRCSRFDGPTPTPMLGWPSRRFTRGRLAAFARGTRERSSSCRGRSSRRLPAWRFY